MSNTNIPTYPIFNKLRLADHKQLLKHINQFVPYSDFGFVSMYCWDTTEELRISFLHENLVVLFQDYEDSTKFFSLLGEKNIDNCLNLLIQKSIADGYGETLRLIPEVVVNSIADNSKYNIEEDRDNFDYILSAEQLAELIGSKNEDRRYRVKKFLSLYAHTISERNIDLRTVHGKTEIIKVLDYWNSHHNRKDDGTGVEYKAIIKLLDNADQLPVEAIAIYDNDKIIAFSIFETLSDG